MLTLVIVHQSVWKSFVHHLKFWSTIWEEFRTGREKCLSPNESARLQVC